MINTKCTKFNINSSRLLSPVRRKRTRITFSPLYASITCNHENMHRKKKTHVAELKENFVHCGIKIIFNSNIFNIRWNFSRVIVG